jgi:hypothetical protein
MEPRLGFQGILDLRGKKMCERENLTKTPLKASHEQAVSTYNANPVNVSFNKHPSKDELQILFNRNYFKKFPL